MKNQSDHRLFKDLFDFIPEPILILKIDKFQIKYANQEFQFLFKKSINFLINKNLSDLFKDDLFFLSTIKEVSKKTGTFYLKDVFSNRNRLFNVISVIPEKNEKFMMLIFKTKSKKNGEDLQNFSFFENFFSIISHEISNPLSSIKIASQLIERSKEVDLELLKIIRTECTRINKIILSVSELSNKITLKNKKNENIHEILRYCIFKIQNKSDKVEVKEEFDPSLPKVLVDKNGLIQVFDNLLINAYESTKFIQNSYIKVTTKFIFGKTIKIPNIQKSQKQNYISIKIDDNGVGLKNIDLEKIFHPFFTTKKSGSGIGLYLVKRIIDLHDGDISVKYLNSTTSFIVRLPI